MNDEIIMEIILTILTISIFAGIYAIKRLNDSVKSYSSSYGTEIGKIDATTRKLDQIQIQLAQSVQISESIKTDIQHGAWRNRELELLKREKLEQYLLNYYEAIEFLTNRMREVFFYDETHYDKSSHAKLTMIQQLYLPELDSVHIHYLKLYANFSGWLADGMKELQQKKRPGELRPTISSEHMKKYPVLLAEASEATLAIEAKVKEIGRNINVA